MLFCASRLRYKPVPAKCGRHRQILGGGLKPPQNVIKPHQWFEEFKNMCLVNTYSKPT